MEFIEPYNKQEDVLMPATGIKSWKFTTPDRTSVVIEGVYQDIPGIVSEIKDPQSELGKIARSNTFILKVRGFHMSAIREDFHSEGKEFLDEFFPVQCKFDIDKKGYVVMRSDRPAFKVGQIIP